MKPNLQAWGARLGHGLEHGLAYVPLCVFLSFSTDGGGRLLLWPALALLAAILGPLLLNRRLFRGGRLRLEGSMMGVLALGFWAATGPAGESWNAFFVAGLVFFVSAGLLAAGVRYLPGPLSLALLALLGFPFLQGLSAGSVPLRAFESPELILAGSLFVLLAGPRRGWSVLLLPVLWWLFVAWSVRSPDLAFGCAALALWLALSPFGPRCDFLDRLAQAVIGPGLYLALQSGQVFDGRAVEFSSAVGIIAAQALLPLVQGLRRMARI